MNTINSNIFLIFQFVYLMMALFFTYMQLQILNQLKKQPVRYKNSEYEKLLNQLKNNEKPRY